jgi:hypothetical protein
VTPVEFRASSLRRSPGERLLAWIVTGPLGHLWSAVADVTLLLGRYLASRLRRSRRSSFL